MLTITLIDEKDMKNFHLVEHNEIYYISVIVEVKINKEGDNHEAD